MSILDMLLIIVPIIGPSGVTVEQCVASLQEHYHTADEPAQRYCTCYINALDTSLSEDDYKQLELYGRTLPHDSPLAGKLNALAEGCEAVNASYQTTK